MELVEAWAVAARNRGGRAAARRRLHTGVVGVRMGERLGPSGVRQAEGRGQASSGGGGLSVDPVRPSGPRLGGGDLPLRKNSPTPTPEPTTTTATAIRAAAGTFAMSRLDIRCGLPLLRARDSPAVVDPGARRSR